MSISKCLFPYNKKPELTNEHFDHDHTIMGCCNVDYRDDNIIMSRHNNRQLTTFTGNESIENANNNQLSLQTTSNQDLQQQFCELNTASMHFNTYNQLNNSLTVTNLAGSSCSTRDLYDRGCIYSNTNLATNLGNLSTSSAIVQAANSSLALANTASTNNCSSPAPPLTPPPSYEASTSMQQLSLPLSQTQAMILKSGNTTNKLFHDHSSFTNSLLHNYHPRHPHQITQSSYVDYTNRYQSLNRKVHPKLEEFKQNNLVVNLDGCTNFKANFNNPENNFNNSKSLDNTKGNINENGNVKYGNNNSNTKH